MTSYSFSSTGDNNDLNVFQNSSNSTVSENALLSDGQSVSLVAMQNNIATNTADISSMNSVTTLSLGIGMGATSSEGQYFPTMLNEELMRLSHGKMRVTLFTNPNSVTGLGPGGSGTNELLTGLVDGALLWSNSATGASNISQLPSNGLATAYTSLTALEINEYYTSEQGKYDYDVIYADTSFIGLPACEIGPEAFGWSKTEIKSLADMKDLSSIRMPGGLLRTVATNVYGNGVVSDTLSTPSATALGVSNETLDFWEWNGLPGDETWLGSNSPSALQKLKAGTSYPYYYPQSVHQETLLADLVMTKTRFNLLTEQQKLWLREACAIVSRRFYDNRLHKGIEIESKIRDPSNTEWSSTIQIQDTPLDIIEAFKAETVRLLDLAATTDVSLSLMLNKLKDFAKRKASNTRVATLETNVTTLTNEKTDLQYQALFNTYGRELYELTSGGVTHWQNQDPSGYELFGDPSAGLVGNLFHFRNAPFMYPRCLTAGFLKPYVDFSATVVNSSYSQIRSGLLATNGGYVLDASATQPTSRTRLTFNDFLPVSENTFNGTNPFGVYKPLNDGSDIKGEIFENDMIGMTTILSKVPYKNYVLEFDFKHTNSAAYQSPGWSSVNGINSGIFFHAQNNPNNKEHSYIPGSWYQVQNRLKIDPATGSNDLSNSRAPVNIGAVFGGSGLKLPTESSAKVLNNSGFGFQCNNDLSLSDAFYTSDTHFKLTVDASSIEVEISGVQVTWYDSVNEISINKITTLGLNSGYVGFELEESGIEVKNIYISPLPSA